MLSTEFSRLKACAPSPDEVEGDSTRISAPHSPFGECVVSSISLNAPGLLGDNMKIWKIVPLLALAACTGVVALTQTSLASDCVHCGKSQVEISFDGKSVEVINTSIDEVVDWLSRERGHGKVMTQADAAVACNMIVLAANSRETQIEVFKKITEHMAEKYDVKSFSEIYRGVRCPPGISMLSTALLYNNLTVAIELFKLHIPLNSINEKGETDLDYAVRRVKDLKQNKKGSIYALEPFFKLFRGKKKNYDVPLLTCEIERTCSCPFTLAEMGAECTPPQR